MKILLLAAGSQGDVRPFAALGSGLARLGHQVSLATHEAFRGIATDAGVGFSLVRGNPMDIVQGEAGQAWLSSMDNPLRFLRTTSRIAGEIIQTLNDDAWAAAQGCDALIYSLPLSLSGHTIADALGIPGIPAALYPLHPTRVFPSIMTPNLPRMGGGANWLSGFLVMQAFWLMFRSHQNRWRKSRLGLGPLPRRAPFEDLRRLGVPCLYGFSPSLIPVPDDWRGAGTVCGYWFLEPDRAWSPPSDLVEFLEDGPPPLYVGFGSMASEDPGRTAAVVLDALQQAGQRAVLASGWGGLRGSGLPPTVKAVEFVPHDWLFSRVSGAVHHGGAGTTAAALRAGIPSVIVPFFADQFFWAARLNALGMSPPGVPQKELTAEKLAGAIRAIMETADMRDRCGKISQAIRSENGVQTAASAADRYLRSVIPARIH